MGQLIIFLLVSAWSLNQGLSSDTTFSLLETNDTVHSPFNAKKKQILSAITFWRGNTFNDKKCANCRLVPSKAKSSMFDNLQNARRMLDEKRTNQPNGD